MTGINRNGSTKRIPDELGKQFAVALFEPENPLNVGSIARTCACTGFPLHLVGRLGFHLDNRIAKRAGLDYWEHCDSYVHVTWENFEMEMKGRRMWMFSTKGENTYNEIEYEAGDVLVFGSESAGLPVAMLEINPDRVVTIPMLEGRRSLNLSNAVAVAIYQVISSISLENDRFHKNL